MSYLGKGVQYGHLRGQTETADGSSASVTLDYTINDEHAIAVYIGNVHQEPGVAYTVASGGGSITFTSTPANGDKIYIRYLGIQYDTSVPIDNSVTSAKIAVNAVGSSEIANNAVGSTQIAANSITAEELATNAIATLYIADNSVTSVKIAENNITSRELAGAVSATTSVTAPLIEGSTSVQTPLIEYTDGDDAITIADGGLCTFGQAATFNGGVIFNEDSADVDHRFETNNDANALMINGGEDVVHFGHNASNAVRGIAPRVQIHGTDQASSGLTLTRYQANAYGPGIHFAKSRNATIGSHTIVQDGDRLGDITWYGSDGGDFVSHAASIYAEVDGTPGTDDTPGRLIFQTTADGAASATTRMVIDSAGDIGIGTTSPSSFNSNTRNLVIRDSGSGGITISTGTSNTGYLAFNDGVDSTIEGLIAYNQSNDVMSFRTASVDDRIVIDGSGHVGVGTSSPQTELHVSGSNNSTGVVYTAVGAGNIPSITIGNESTTDNVNAALFFRDGGDMRASIHTRFVSHASGDQKSNLIFATAGSGNTRERMYLTEDGKLGVGTASPSAYIQTENDISAYHGANEWVTIRGLSSGQYIEYGSGQDLSFVGVDTFPHSGATVHAVMRSGYLKTYDGYRVKKNAATELSGAAHYDVSVKHAAYRHTVTAQNITDGYADVEHKVYRDNYWGHTVAIFDSSANVVYNGIHADWATFATRYASGDITRVGLGNDVAAGDYIKMIIFWHSAYG